MHTSPFVSSDPVLLEDVESSEEYDSKDSLHFCEDDHSSSPLIECEPLPVSPEYVVIGLYQDTSMSFHDKSLEMENQWAKESCEEPTLESNEKDSSNEHGNFTFTYHVNHAHSMQLQSQACLVHRAHTRTTTIL